MPNISERIGQQNKARAYSENVIAQYSKTLGRCLSSRGTTKLILAISNQFALVLRLFPLRQIARHSRHRESRSPSRIVRFSRINDFVLSCLEIEQFDGLRQVHETQIPYCQYQSKISKMGGSSSGGSGRLDAIPATKTNAAAEMTSSG